MVQLLVVAVVKLYWRLEYLMDPFSGFSGSSGGPSVFPCDLRQHMLAPVLAVPGRLIFGPVGGFFGC